MKVQAELDSAFEEADGKKLQVMVVRASTHGEVYLIQS